MAVQAVADLAGVEVLPDHPGQQREPGVLPRRPDRVGRRPGPTAAPRSAAGVEVEPQRRRRRGERQAEQQRVGVVALPHRRRRRRRPTARTRRDPCRPRPARLAAAGLTARPRGRRRSSCRPRARRERRRGRPPRGVLGEPGLAVERGQRRDRPRVEVERPQRALHELGGRVGAPRRHAGLLHARLEPQPAGHDPVARAPSATASSCASRSPLIDSRHPPGEHLEGDLLGLLGRVPPVQPQPAQAEEDRDADQQQQRRSRSGRRARRGPRSA